MKIKKHSSEFLADGKLKVWCHIIGEIKRRGKTVKENQKLGQFTVIVDAKVTREELDAFIKAEYEKVKALEEQRKKTLKTLGIGEEVK